MNPNPLASPKDGRLLELFLARLDLKPARDPSSLLGPMARAFANLPYENLTKIIKESVMEKAERSRRLPAEVLDDHFRLGTGGTCFSLTAAFLHLVRSLGIQAQPILADRRYGADTHCAILVELEQGPHLIDPGYLIVDPIPLPKDGAITIPSRFNQLQLNPNQDGSKVELHTVSSGRKTYRLTFKTQAADPGDFLKAWDNSFDWDMMHYPVLSKVYGQSQLYLRGTWFQSRSGSKVERDEIPSAELCKRIASDFGIHLSVVERAMAVLKQKGEVCGQP